MAFLAACSDLTCETSEKRIEIAPLLEAKTLSEIGSGQGVQILQDSIYLFGDGETGIVQELDMDLNFTGWLGRLTYGGEDLIPHPTGLAFREGSPTFIGGLVGTTGKIYQIDWDLFREDGDLDRALIRVIEDTESGSGTRPEYVEYQGQAYVATADYEGDAGSEVRLMDPQALAESSSTSETGVVAHRFPVGNYIQNLRWDPQEGQILLVQNILRDRGWRLSAIDLNLAVQEGDGTGDALIRTYCFDRGSELEGYASLDDGREIFLTGGSGENLFSGFDITGE